MYLMPSQGHVAGNIDGRSILSFEGRLSLNVFKKRGRNSNRTRVGLGNEENLVRKAQGLSLGETELSSQ